jgi:hypothetical protein
MKKLLALLLILCCAFSLAACGNDQDNDQNNDDNNSQASAEIIEKIDTMFTSSNPTKTVVGTTQTTGDTVLVGEYTLTVGTVNGLDAATYYQDYDRLISVDESGALDYVTGTVVNEPIYKEYLEGKGVRVDGGEWDATQESFVSKNGPISLKLKEDLVSKSQYDNSTKTFSCIVSKDNTKEVLGLEENLPVDITIETVDDGASINKVTISYVIPATAKDQEISIVIRAFYTYDLEDITIDLSTEEE